MSLTHSDTTQVPVSGPFTLAGNLRWADLRVRAADAATVATITVTATGLRAQDLLAATQVGISDNRVDIEVPNPLRLLAPGTSLRVEAEVPVGSALAVRGGSGDVTAYGRYADAEVRLGSGDLHLEHAESAELETGSGDLALGGAGLATIRVGSGDLTIGEVEDLRARGGSGNMTIGAVHGSGEVRAGSGRVTLQRITGEVSITIGSGALHLGEITGIARTSSGSGSLTVERLSSGRLESSTASGSQRIGVPHGTALQVEADTRSGRVRSELDQLPGSEGFERSAVVIARATSGSITFTRAR